MGMDVRTTMLRVASQLDAASASVQQGADVGERSVLLPITRGRGHQHQGARQARMAVEQLETAGPSLAGVRAATSTALKGLEEVLAKRPRIAPTQLDEFGRRFRLQADLLRLRAQLDELPAHEARAVAQREFEQVVDRSARSITNEDRWRFTLLSLLPDGQRPQLHPPVRTGLWAENARLATDHREMATRVAAEELASQRLALEAARQVPGPGVTRDAFLAEARDIVSTPPDQLSQAHLERLTFIARLPDDLRPRFLDAAMPTHVAPTRPRELPPAAMLAFRQTDAASSIARLRLVAEAEELVEAGLTKQAVTDELVTMLARSPEELTTDDLRRISVLARLPEQLAPAPTPGRNGVPPLEDFSLLGRHPSDEYDAYVVWDQGRRAMVSALDPDVAAEAIAARIDAGKPMGVELFDIVSSIDARSVQRHGLPERVARLMARQHADGQLVDLRNLALLDGHPDVMTRHGIDELRASHALRALGSAGSRDARIRGPLADNLAAVREQLAGARVPDELIATRGEMVELADRNLARMAGTRLDTYDHHPDYAEIGRIVATMNLVNRLDPPASRIEHAARAMTSATETLTW
jgi:hypothetical protein